MRVGRYWALHHPALFVGAVAATSVVASMLLTSVAVAVSGTADATMWWVSLLIALVVPTSVSVPISKLILGLVKEAEDARREARWLADVDPLTGAMTRRRFIELAEPALVPPSRDPHGAPTGCSVLLIDIDEFKAVNDTHGHLAGDLVLSVIAAHCSSVLGPHEALCRWGGEEFVLLLRGDGHRARIVAEEMRGQIAGLHESRAELPCAISISVGVAAGHWPLDAAIAAADAALYRAKRGGRNRVVSAEDRPDAALCAVEGSA